TFNDTTLARHAKRALNSDWVKPTKRVFNNAKVSDHHAIIPTGASPARLDEFERKIFDMVARRTIAVFYPAAQFEVTTRITRGDARTRPRHSSDALANHRRSDSRWLHRAQRKRAYRQRQRIVLDHAAAKFAYRCSMHTGNDR